MADERSPRRNSEIEIELEDRALLRATSLVTVLQCCAAHFGGTSLASFEFSSEEAEKLFSQSRQVDHLLYFLSHTWHDSRIEKWIALCLHFNLYGAFLMTCALVIIAKALVLLSVLPTVKAVSLSGETLDYGPWCTIIGTTSLYVCIHSWHNMPVRLLGSRGLFGLFFDKLCVHQADIERKRAGIRSFAAFIAKSDRVICLWSPRYFSRLWCTLEMAAMVTTNRVGTLPLVFLPLKLYKYAHVVSIVFAFNQFCFIANFMLGYPVTPSSFMTILAIFGTLALSHVTHQYIKDRRELITQLETFSVENAACYSEDDRDVVYQALRSWFGDLGAFNELVRTKVHRHITAAIGNEVHVPFGLIAPILLLQLVYHCDDAFSGWYSFPTGGVNALSVLEDSAWAFCMCSYLPVQLRIVSCLSFPSGRRTVNVCLTLMSAAIGIVIICGQFVAIYVLLPAVGQVWPMALITLCSALWFMWLQKESFGCRGTRTSSSSFSAPTPPSESRVPFPAPCAEPVVVGLVSNHTSEIPPELGHHKLSL